MGEISNISWTDSTVNDWIGCSKVGPGCANCYAEALDNRKLFGEQSHWGHGAPRLKSKSAAALREKLNRKPWICDGCGRAYRSALSIRNLPDAFKIDQPEAVICDCGSAKFHRRRIFSLSLGDWLDPEIPIEWLAEMLNSIRLSDQCAHILCTKRPELWRDRINDAMLWLLHHGFKQRNKTATAVWLSFWKSAELVPHNIWLLASVENQEAANKRIPELLKIPAAVHGISAEPLLGPIDLKPWLNTGKIGWVIAGGES